MMTSKSDTYFSKPFGPCEPSTQLILLTLPRAAVLCWLATQLLQDAIPLPTSSTPPPSSGLCGFAAVWVRCHPQACDSAASRRGGRLRVWSASGELRRRRVWRSRVWGSCRLVQLFADLGVEGVEGGVGAGLGCPIWPPLTRGLVEATHWPFLHCARNGLGEVRRRPVSAAGLRLLGQRLEHCKRGVCRPVRWCVTVPPVAGDNVGFNKLFPPWHFGDDYVCCRP